MNANQIHIGEEYAISPGIKPRGNGHIYGAYRIKAMRVYGESEAYKSNQTMYVEGFRLNTLTGDLLSTTYVKFRVRDVIGDWDEYEDESERQEILAKQRQERIAQERIERDAAAEKWRIKRQLEYDHEAALRENARLDNERLLKLVKQGLAIKGINATDIYIDSYNNKITINLAEIKRWLKL